MRLGGYWHAFFVGLCAFALLGVLAVTLAPELAGVFLCGLYSIPSNSVFPIPHEPGVLFFAKYYDPLWIGAAATLGSIVVSFADYAMVGTMLRRSSRARDSRLVRWGVRWMERWPFGVVVAFSLLPLPISVIRVLAPASGYPIGRYIAAQIVGRFPRFYLLALVGHWIALPTWLLVAATLGLTLAVMLAGRAEPEASREGPGSTGPESSISEADIVNA